MTASNVDAYLEIIPENEIIFTLKETEGSPKVSLTLKHPDPDSGPIAFKVSISYIKLLLFSQQRLTP